MQSICVFCGSSDTIHVDYLSAARQMGRTLARRGVRLVYGGGKTGLMGALADGALGAHTHAVVEAYKDFRAVAEKIAKEARIKAK